MLAPNIEKEVKAFIEREGKGGWLRTEQCAKYYGKDNDSRKTYFYRWRRKVEKRRVRGFRVLKIPGNVSFIGLESSDPKEIELLIDADKKLARSVGSGFGFWAWLEKRGKRKNLEAQNRYRTNIGPALASYRNRAENNGAGFLKELVKEEDELDRKIRKENRS